MRLQAFRRPANYGVVAKWLLRLTRIPSRTLLSIPFGGVGSNPAHVDILFAEFWAL